MTEQLEAAWRTSSKPFHHETLSTADLVQIDTLQPFLKSVLAHLELYYPGASLLVFDDWHAHDGFVVPPIHFSLQELRQHLHSTDSLYQWRTGDFEVYRAVYPESLDFLLRIHVLDEDEDPDEYPGVWGRMSFTGFGFDLSEIAKRGHGVAGLNFERDVSKDYFDKIYAG